MSVASMKRRNRSRARTLRAAFLATLTVTVAPVAHAAPLQPGDGDDFFIQLIENSSDFSPKPSVSAVRAIIPLARQVCDARANGQDDLQAAHLVWAGKGVDTLGVANGSVIGLEHIALDVVGDATLAYCPKYNNGNW
jgi:hypothetical protein